MKFFRVISFTAVCSLFFLGETCFDKGLDLSEVCAERSTKFSCENSEARIANQDIYCMWQKSSFSMCPTVKGFTPDEEDGVEPTTIDLQTYCTGKSTKGECIDSGCVYNSGLGSRLPLCFPPICIVSKENGEDTGECELKAPQNRGLVEEVLDERNDAKALKFCAPYVPAVEAKCVLDRVEKL